MINGSVPKYPFRTIIWVKNGTGLRSEVHNLETLASAMACRAKALARPLTRRVEILTCLSDTTVGSEDHAD